MEIRQMREALPSLGTADVAMFLMTAVEMLRMTDVLFEEAESILDYLADEVALVTDFLFEEAASLTEFLEDAAGSMADVLLNATVSVSEFSGFSG